MSTPFSKEQNDVLSKTFDTVNTIFKRIYTQIDKLIFCINVHNLILSNVIAILIFQNKDQFDDFTISILWVLLILSLCFIIVPRKDAK